MMTKIEDMPEEIYAFVTNHRRGWFDASAVKPDCQPYAKYTRAAHPVRVKAGGLKREFISRLDGSDPSTKAFAKGLIQGIFDDLAATYPAGLIIEGE